MPPSAGRLPNPPTNFPFQPRSAAPSADPSISGPPVSSGSAEATRVWEFFLQFPCDVDLFSPWWHRGPRRAREGRPATCRCIPPAARQYRDCLFPASKTPEGARRPAPSRSNGCRASGLSRTWSSLGYQFGAAGFSAQAPSPRPCKVSRVAVDTPRNDAVAPWALRENGGQYTAKPLRGGRTCTTMPVSSGDAVIYKGSGRPSSDGVLEQFGIPNPNPSSLSRRSLFPFPFYTYILHHRPKISLKALSIRVYGVSDGTKPPACQRPPRLACCRPSRPLLLQFWPAEACPLSHCHGCILPPCENPPGACGRS